VHAELRKGGRPDATRDEAGTEGKVWHPRCVVKAAWKAGYRMQTLQLDPTKEGAVDLRVVLKSDGVYAIEGVQNKTYYHGKHKWGADVEGPEVVPNEWRHVIAWKDGVGLDWEFDETGTRHADGGVVPLADLWLRAGNKVNPDKGYFRKILKVYTITPRAVKRGADELVQPSSAAPPSPLAKVGPPRISLEEAIRTRNFAAIKAKVDFLAVPGLLQDNVFHHIVDAAATGDLELFVCLHGLNLAIQDHLCEVAAQHGQLPVLKFLHEQTRFPWSSVEVQFAAAKGHVGCLDYLLTNRCPWTTRAFADAIRNGHHGCLSLLNEKAQPLADRGISWCGEAVGSGRLETLVFLRAHGCTWNENTFKIACESAAERKVLGGSPQQRLAIVHYLLIEGCPCDPDDCEGATRGIARHYLWPKLRRACRNVLGLLHVWRFTLVASGQHGTAAASLKLDLDSLANDEAMLPLAPAVAPVAAAAGITKRTVRQLARCGGVKLTAEGAPIDPLASKLRRL